MKKVNCESLVIGGRIAILLLSLLFTACRGGQSRTMSIEGDTLTMRYAEHLTMIEHDGYTEVQIHSPWNKGRLLQTLRVDDRSKQRALFFTASHSSLVEELGCIDAIAGICESEYVANPQLRKALAEGRIKDMGSAMTPDRERIVSLAPDVIFVSPYENASTYGNLESLGVPIVQCSDYMETSALGRAEWMRLYGRLFGKGHEADSLFFAIEAEYHALRALTDSLALRPSVLFDTRNGSAWYVPGGCSTMARLVADAGGNYIFSDNEKSGSVPLSFESVLHRGEEADVWLLRYNNSQARMTLADLGAVYQPYTLFKAYREGRVYGCNSAHLLFHEETPFHPERLLRDYIHILHPELCVGDTLRYFHPL